MNKQHRHKEGLVVSIVLAALAWSLPGLADSHPYWDNSSSSTVGGGATTPAPDPNSSFYPASPPSNPYGNGGNGNYGGPPQNSPPYGNGNNYGSQQGYSTYGQNSQSLHGYVSTAPAGTTMAVTNTTSLSSQTSHTGDPVTFTLGSDVSSGGSLILPAGSQIQGEVVSSVPAGRLEHGGQLQLRFTRALTPDGRSFPLSARLITQDGTGIIKGGTTKSVVGGAAKNTLGGAAIGGLGGTALGALTGGRPLQGLLWGSVLGAGAGLGKTAFDKGQEAQIQPGTQLQIMLDQPLTVSPNGGVSNNNYGSY